MVAFSGRIFIFGYGMVGKSFLRLLKNEVIFEMKQLFVIDMSLDDRNEFIKEGGYKDNFLVHHVTKENHLSIYEKYLRQGDALLDFSEKTSNNDTLTWCLEQGVFYLSTSASSWPEDDLSISAYDQFISLIEREKKYQKGYPTAVVEIGCNPGLVSLFAKKALREMAQAVDPNLFSKEELVALRDYQRKGQSNHLAKALGVDAIIISDYDTLSVNGEIDNDDTLYSTWSPSGLYDEAVAHVEFRLGTDFNIETIQDKVKIYHEHDGYIQLNLKGIDTLETTYSPHGYFEGHLITHEETMSLASYLSILNEEEKSLYRPTVYFSYRPNELAVQALVKVKQSAYQKPKAFKKLDETLVSGGEYVGVIINSQTHGAYYYGSGLELDVLKRDYPKETPTIIQVTATAVSAFKWMLKNPQLGLVLPEKLPEDEILKDAQKYLKQYDFHPIKEAIVPLQGLLDKPNKNHK